MKTDEIRAAFEAVLDRKHTSTIGRGFSVSDEKGRDRFFEWWHSFTAEVGDEMGRKAEAVGRSNLGRFQVRDIVRFSPWADNSSLSMDGELFKVEAVMTAGDGRCFISSVSEIDGRYEEDDKCRIWADFAELTVVKRGLE